MTLLYYKTYTTTISPQSEWLVFLHGLGGNHQIWYKQLEAFKHKYNLLFVDLRGHGGSAELGKEKKSYSFSCLAKDVITVLDQLKIKRAHFIGISLGTIVNHTIAQLAPERIISMVQGGAVTHFSFKSQFWLQIGDLLKRVMPYMWIYRLFAWIMMPKKNHQRSRMIFVREALKLGQLEFIKWFSVLKAETNHIFPRLKQNAKQLRFPVLYISGSEDHMFVNRLKQDIQQLPAARFLELQACGHVCNIEKAEEFNQHVLQFLKEHAAVLLKRKTS